MLQFSVKVCRFMEYRELSSAVLYGWGSEFWEKRSKIYFMNINLQDMAYF